MAAMYKTKVMVYYIDHRKLESLMQSPEFLSKIFAPENPLIADHYLKVWKLQKRNSLQALASGLLLSQVLGVTRDEQLVAGEHGKLGLASEKADGCELAMEESARGKMNQVLTNPPLFSISHARDYTIMAMMGMDSSPGGNYEQIMNKSSKKLLRPLFIHFGADIEERVPAGDERKRRYHASIAEKFFPEKSKARYVQAPDSTREEIFIEEWTALEAVLKAHGTGFALPREEIEAVAARYLVQHAKVGDHVIAVAAEHDFAIELQELVIEEMSRL